MTTSGVLAEIEARASAIHPFRSNDAEDIARQILLHATMTHRTLSRVKACPFPPHELGAHRDRMLDLAAMVLYGITELDAHIELRTKGLHETPDS